MMVQVFISYAREDLERVQRLKSVIESSGFIVWLDVEKILPGEKWRGAIQRALRKSDFIILCLSGRSVSKRGFLQREVRWALDAWNEKLEDDIYLIPLRLDECEIPEILADFQWVDGFTEEALERLITALKVGTSRRYPESAPGTPSVHDRKTQPREEVDLSALGGVDFLDVSRWLPWRTRKD